MRDSTDTPLTVAQAERTNGAPPRLSPGVELMGQLQGSGFKEPAFMLRRADGQVIQLPHLLYLVAAEMDGQRVPEEIAERVTHQAQRGVDADSVRFLVDEKLRPLGLVHSPNGHGPAPRKADPLLALSWRKAVLPGRYVRALTTIFRPLFTPAIVAAVIACLAALDAWLFLSHGISQPLRGVLYQPALLLAMFAAVVVATVFHEIGHATACRYGGAKPGPLGIGLYVVWPVFYSDVTDAYRLDRVGRLRTDLGGVYFNAIVALAAGGAYFATGYEPLLLLVAIQNFAILQQLLPLGRLDGYLILSDLTGVPDILGRVKPVLRSLVPWREPDERVKDLKPRVRVVTSVYILILIPVLLFALSMMIIHAPRVFATAYDSLGVRYEQVSAALRANEITVASAGLLQIVALAAPCVGIVATTVRVGRRSGSAAMTWSAGNPFRQFSVWMVVSTTAALAAFTWWPNGDYRPIQPGERGTVQSGAASLREVPSGRPSLPRYREAELHGAPTARERLSHPHDQSALGPRPAPPESRSALDGGEPGESHHGIPLWLSPEHQGPDTGATPPETTPPAQAGSVPDPQGTSGPAPSETPSDTTTTPSDTTTAPSGDPSTTGDSTGTETPPSDGSTSTDGTTTQPPDGTTTDPTTTTPGP
jgi:putative peptide zinc metalloprotease protein